MRLNIQLFASSGTINGSSTATNADCKIEWKATDDNTNNKSSVKATLYIKRSGSSSTTGTFSGSITINGTKKDISKKFSPYNWGDWAAVGSATVNVTHNNDGTKNCSISGSVKNTGTSMAGTYSASGTATLNTIPRQSTISSITNVGIGNTCNVNLSIKKPDVYHRLYVSYDGTNYIEKSQVDPQSSILSFTISSSDITNYQYAFNFDMYVKVKTYTDSAMTNQLGVDVISSKQTLNVPSYDLSLTNVGILDQSTTYNTYKNDMSDIIKNISNINFSFLIPKHYNAYYTEATLNGNSYSSIYDNSIIFVNIAPSNTYTLKVKDSRGVGGTFTIDGSTYAGGLTTTHAPTINYTQPTIDYLIERVSATSQTMNIYFIARFYDGENLKTANLETPTVTFRYSTDNGVTWNTLTIPAGDTTTTDTSIKVSTTYTSSDATFYKKNFNYSIEVSDKIGVTRTINDLVPSGQPAMYMFKYGGETYTNVYDHLLLDWKPVATTDMIPTNVSDLTNDAGYTISSDVYYSPGDIVEIGSNYYITSGFVTSNTKSVRVTVITPKRLDNITTITCNSLRVEARTSNGYLNNETGYHEFVGRSGYTGVNCSKASDNAITVTIEKNTAYSNVTNNTYVVLNGYFKFTLS